jgi:hypothetical protein
MTLAEMIKELSQYPSDIEAQISTGPYFNPIAKVEHVSESDATGDYEYIVLIEDPRATVNAA